MKNNNSKNNPSQGLLPFSRATQMVLIIGLILTALIYSYQKPKVQPKLDNADAPAVQNDDAPAAQSADVDLKGSDDMKDAVNAASTQRVPSAQSEASNASAAPQESAGPSGVTAASVAINHEIPDFTLVDNKNQPFHFYEHQNSLKLVYLGFASCPQICPEVLSKIAEVEDAMRKYGKPIEAIFISIDPIKDTPEQLDSFLSNLSKNIIGLTGTPEQIQQVANHFGATYFETQDKDQGGLNHTSFIYVLDGSRYVHVFHKDDPASNIIKYLNQYQPIKQ